MTFDIQEGILRTNESLILDYFRRVKSGDLLGLSNLFSDDSIIYEPFSKLKCVTGKSAIESFLRTVVMANTGLQHEIRIEKRGQKANENSIVVLVTFYKGDSITGRFTFEFEPPDEFNRGRIKLLLSNLQIKRTGAYL